MRWLFLILLLLNVALFGWFYQEQVGRSQLAARNAQEPAGLAGLTLLHEAQEGQLRPRPAQPVPGKRRSGPREVASAQRAVT